MGAVEPRTRARLARFSQPKADPGSTVALAADHPAVVEGRTIFPGRVLPTGMSQRFLISGHNNAKIGKVVEKGPWSGMPIFTLTLEERATCPRTCEQWRQCYGNSMQWPSRWDHRDPDFLPALAAEISVLGRQHRNGFVVRLHVLGDFYSAPYVYFWADQLARVPSLHVYGYTARRVDDPDAESARIARAIKVLTDSMWTRFAVRTSASEDIARSRAIVVEAPSEDPGVIMCPAQVSATETCGTCGLCWAEAARDKTIGFLLHGMKRSSGPRAPRIPVAAPSLSVPDAEIRRELSFPGRRDTSAVAKHQADDDARLMAALVRLAKGGREVQASLRVLAEASSIPQGSVLFVVRRLTGEGRIEVRRGLSEGSRRPATNVYVLRDGGHPQAVVRAQRGAGREDPELGRAELPRSYRKPERPATKVADTSLPRKAAPPPAPALRAPIDIDMPDTSLRGPAGSLVALRPGQCKWPVNSWPAGSGHLARFCCKPQAGDGPYCPAHGGRP